MVQTTGCGAAVQSCLLLLGGIRATAQACLTTLLTDSRQKSVCSHSFMSVGAEQRPIVNTARGLFDSSNLFESCVTGGEASFFRLGGFFQRMSQKGEKHFSEETNWYHVTASQLRCFLSGVYCFAITVKHSLLALILLRCMSQRSVMEVQGSIVTQSGFGR